jgi:hypothetical protein
MPNTDSGVIIHDVQYPEVTAISQLTVNEIQ